jgi:putative transposase
MQEYKEYCAFRLFVNDFRTHIKQKPLEQVPFQWMNNTSLDRKIRLALNSRELYCPTDVMQGERTVARKAFSDGFTSEKGMAKFRRSNILHGAFSWTNARTKIYDNHFNLSARMKNIKVHRERKFPENSKLKAVRVKKENDKFFVVFSIEIDKKKLSEKDFENQYQDSLGMDTNNGHLDFSDGSVLKYKRSLTIGELKKLKNKQAKKLVNELNKMDFLQKKQSKREDKAKNTKSKVSKNYYKTQKKINKIQNKIKNRRKNLLDKVSNEILSKAFSVLFLEDLAVQKMTAKKNDKKSKSMSKWKSKQMRKNILNFSYSTLHSMLSYKAMLNERLVIFVDPRNTTKTCSACGNIKNMKLSDRKYICNCGLNIDRDLNSAINIHQRGITFFEELNSSCLTAIAA